MKTKEKIKYFPISNQGNTSFFFDHVRVLWNEQVEFHYQETWELSYVIKGGGMRVIGNKAEPFRQGEDILIPLIYRIAGRLMSLRPGAMGKSKISVLRFRPLFRNGV